MKQKAIKTWINALESGEYAQEKEKLCSEKGDSFCCLGVLTNEYCVSKGESFDDVTRFSSVFKHHLSIGMSKYEAIGEAASDVFETSNINTKVREWVGLRRNKILLSKLKPTCEGTKRVMQGQKYHRARVRATDLLAMFNDETNIGFAGIAQFIKKNKAVLFE